MLLVIKGLDLHTANLKLMGRWTDTWNQWQRVDLTSVSSTLQG